jgi:hypothetical protein
VSYLDRLKKSANAGGSTLQNQQNPETVGFVGFEGTPPGPFQKAEGAEAANDSTPDASLFWLLHFAGRNPLAIRCAPAATLAEVLAIYPAALTAAPLASLHGLFDEAGDDAPSAAARADADRWWAGLARSCRTCADVRRPGLAMHCGGDRPDLPHAYTPSHPLRRLPADRGASCAVWAVPP